jgi:hypothetical protein
MQGISDSLNTMQLAGFINPPKFEGNRQYNIYDILANRVRFINPASFYYWDESEIYPLPSRDSRIHGNDKANGRKNSSQWKEELITKQKRNYEYTQGATR